MRKTLYTQLRQRLFALTDAQGNSLIQHVDLFNEQLLYAAEEQPFLTPAVFVEFAPIAWKHQLHGVRDAEVEFTLHIITENRVGHWEDATNVFALLDAINAHLHAFHYVAPDGTVVIDAITLQQSITDHSFGELADNREVFACHATDSTAYNNNH